MGNRLARSLYHTPRFRSDDERIARYIEGLSLIGWMPFREANQPDWRRSDDGEPPRPIPLPYAAIQIGRRAHRALHRRSEPHRLDAVPRSQPARLAALRRWGTASPDPSTIRRDSGPAANRTQPSGQRLGTSPPHFSSYAGPPARAVQFGCGRSYRRGASPP